MLINGRIYFKIIDRLNISIIILILFLSFISIDSQRKWTMFYSNIMELRNKNNNIIGYISKTEQYFLNQIDSQHNIKKTNPDDLIYLIKTKKEKKTNFLYLLAKEMSKGFNDGIYKRGY